MDPVFFSPGQDPGSKHHHPALAIAGWAVFVLLFLLILVFSYKVWVYYNQIRRGEVVDLPQFPGRLTRLDGAAAAGAGSVAREQVETPDNPEIGATDAQLTIVEFADFQCPYSKESAQVVRTLAAKYGDRVRFIFRDYPLTTIHPQAFPLALAAECAREQGKFWQFHDKVFLGDATPDTPTVLAYGDEIGLDGAQFQRCITDQRYKDRVMADAAAAESLKLAGTPTFFLNGRRIEGSIPEDAFGQLIERLTHK